MRRLLAYISLTCVALLLAAGAAHAVSARWGAAERGAETGSLCRADVPAAERLWTDADTGYIVPVPVAGADVFSGGGAGGSGARCLRLTGMRRASWSPVFRSADLFLTYLGRASSARAFAAWRRTLCGGSCGAAVSVVRQGDGYVYALRHILI